MLSRILLISILACFYTFAQAQNHKKHDPFPVNPKMETNAINRLDNYLFLNSSTGAKQAVKSSLQINSNNDIQLDSTTSNSGNSYYSYHPNGIIEKKSFIWSTGNSALRQETYSFDSLGRQVSLLLNDLGSIQVTGVGLVDQTLVTYSWDSLNNIRTQILTYNLNDIWNNHLKKNWVYNVNNDLIQSSSFSGNSNNWTPMDKYDLIYNASNQLIETKHFTFDSNQFNLVRISNYTYSSDNLSDTTIYSRFLNGLWVVINKRIQNYDNFGNLLIQEYASLINYQWVPYYKMIKNYNNDDLYIRSITQVWDSTFWRNIIMNEVDYDQFNNISQEVWYDGDSTSWIKDDKTEFNFDSNNNFTSYVVSSWVGNQWVTLLGTGYDVDSTVFVTDLNFPTSNLNNINFWLYNKFTNKLVSSYRLGPDGTGNLIGYDTITYHYTPEINNITKLFQSKLVLFPNPTNSTFKITNDSGENYKVTIMDISGKKLKSLQVSNTDNQIDISELSAGVYIVNIISGKQNITKRILKQ